MASAHQEEIHSYAQSVAKRQAWRLITCFGFPPDDYEDLQQDLLLAFHQRVKAYDPQRGSLKGFARRLIENEGRKILERRQAKRRDYRLCFTINLLGGRWRGGKYDFDARFLLRADIHRALRKLPGKLRVLAEALEKESPTDAARSLGLSRATLYRNVAEIRIVFQAEGLDHRCR